MYKVAPQIAEVLCTVSTKRDKKTKDERKEAKRRRNESTTIALRTAAKTAVSSD